MYLSEMGTVLEDKEPHVLPPTPNIPLTSIYFIQRLKKPLEAEVGARIQGYLPSRSHSPSGLFYF